jgi:hypothetical protein
MFALNVKNTIVLELFPVKSTYLETNTRLKTIEKVYNDWEIA